MADQDEVTGGGAGAQDPVFRSIAASSPDSIMLLDREARIRFINRTAPGLSVDDVIGTPVYAYVPEPQHAAMAACFERVAASGEPDSYENVYTTPDGHLSLWESRVGPVKEAGEVTGFVIIAADVTDRRKAAHDLERIFELSADLLCTVSPDGRFLRVNPAFEKALGYSVEELTGSMALDLVHPDDQATSREALKAVTGGGEVTNLGNRYRCRDGSYRSLQWYASLDPDTNRIIAMARDVTDQRVLQEQLLQAQKMEAIGQLAGGVAHDFNNLLLAVIANKELVAEATADDPRIAEYVAEIGRAAERAADLTRRLLSVARRQPVRARALDLGQVARRMMKLLRRLIPENIEIELELTPELDLVSADSAQMEQVVLNLCLNARDAIGASGRISLRTRNVQFHDGDCPPWARPGRFAVLEVADDGEGMSDAVRERAFEPFFTTKMPGEGTGLGLATAYGIIQEHGGIIHVESQPGEGSRFAVHVPTTTDRPAAAPDRVARGAGEGHETVLVAEDEELVRRVVVRSLKRGGYEVLTAENGERAVEVFREHADDISLVILDVVMPRMSGPSAYKQMAELRPDLSVLFSSGYADHQRIPEPLPAGAPVLDKPYDAPTLLTKVREVLDGPK